MLKFGVFAAFVLSVACSFSQSENVFLERSYWTAMPTVEQIQSDIKKGHDPTAFNQHKFDAITWAIIEGVPNSTVWFLLNLEGNHLDKRAHDGRTPIFWAAYKSNVDLMKQLIEKGAKTNLIDDHGYSVINFAASTGQLNVELYDLCIANGAEIEKEFTKNGATPLLLIVPYLKSAEMIDYFTEKGLSFDQTDAEGNNAFVYAARTGNMPLMEYALEQKLDPRANNDAAMIFASKGARRVKNSVEVFQFLSSLGLSASAKDKDGKTGLHYLASSSKDLEVLNFFVESNNDLNSKDAKGNTPFLEAVSNNSAEIIRYFAEKLDRTDIKNEQGENALHLAAKRNNAKILEFVLTLGIPIDAKTNDGLIALHIAAMKAKDDKLLKLLIAAGANKETLTEFEESAFDLASENEFLEASGIDLTFLK